MSFSGFFASYSRLLIVLISLQYLALAGPTSAPKITKTTREEIIHSFNEDLVYISTKFPMGKTGLRLKDGIVTPNGAELDHLMALWGPAAKPGDQARISDVIIKENYIRFEINGGPIKKPKWYQRVQVSGANSSAPIAPSDSIANARGSFVDLYFDKYVPELTGPELKDLLRPVFDFNSKSALEAYLGSVSAPVRDAIKSHHVLVGMNGEMVIYAKGRPPKRVREHADEADYEEWIYGNPPQDVDFIRFVGDEVVRVETMKVDGQKIVRVDKEVDAKSATVAKKEQFRPANAPTLRRPGEEMPENDRQTPNNTPPVRPPDVPTGPSSQPN